MQEEIRVLRAPNEARPDRKRIFVAAYNIAARVRTIINFPSPMPIEVVGERDAPSSRHIRDLKRAGVIGITPRRGNRSARMQPLISSEYVILRIRVALRE